MCIVIDVNTFAHVFDTKSQKHSDFKPVLDWILFGHGKLVYGGTKYREELAKAKSYLGLFGELSRAKKVVEIDTEQVDAKQRDLEALINHPDFDDPHLIAIIIVSGCKLICTLDARAYPYIKRRALYPSNIKCPKIYRKPSHRNLLSDKYIANICAPNVRLRKAVAQNLLQ